MYYDLSSYFACSDFPNHENVYFVTLWCGIRRVNHYDDVIMSAIASQITSLTIVYSTVYPGADQSKHQSSASLAFVREIHRGPVNSPHKWPVTRKMFPFDDVIMYDSRPFGHEATIQAPGSIFCLRLCSANHRTGYFSNLPRDWLSIV